MGLCGGNGDHGDAAGAPRRVRAHPGLKIALGHPRETLPFLVWRADHAIARPVAKRKVSFRDIFRSHLWATTSGNLSTLALMCGVSEMGVDRILFAVDWPFVRVRARQASRPRYRVLERSGYRFAPRKRAKTRR